MKWDAAVEMTGFAVRGLTSGKLSIRSSQARQWTYNTGPDGETYLDEMPIKYHWHSINKTDWRVLEVGSEEYEYTVAKVGKPPEFKRTDFKIGLRETLIRADQLKEKIEITGKLIDAAELTDGNLDNLLNDLIVYATELKNLL